MNKTPLLRLILYFPQTEYKKITLQKKKQQKLLPNKIIILFSYLILQKKKKTC